jgi:adenylate kinase
MKQNHKRPIIVFLGPQGAGKGTQATLLARRLGFKEVSTGALYRDEIEAGTRLGKLVAREVKAGELVADEITNALLTWRLRQKDVAGGVVLDGYPRTLAQAAALEYIGTPEAVVAFTVPDKVAVERISGRRVCDHCGASYHVKFRPPKKAGLCDRCGGALKRRKDDTPVSVKKRLAVYHKNTEPIFAIYDRTGKLREIAGTGSVEAIAAAVWRAVPEHLKRHHS